MKISEMMQDFDRSPFSLARRSKCLPDTTKKTVPDISEDGQAAILMIAASPPDREWTGRREVRPGEVPGATLAYLCRRGYLEKTQVPTHYNRATAYRITAAGLEAAAVIQKAASR